MAVVYMVTREPSAEPHHGNPEMQTLRTTRLDCLRHYLGYEVCSPVPPLLLIAAVPSLHPYFFYFAFLKILFHFFPLSFLAFYLVRLADLAKEASFNHHCEPVTSKPDENPIIYLWHKSARSYSNRGLWLVSRMEDGGVRNREKSLLPSVLFAALYRYISHFVLKVTGTGFTNKTNKSISGLFQTTVFFKRRFITM